MMQPSQPVRKTTRAQWVLLQLVVIFAAGLQMTCAQDPQPPLTGDQAISTLSARKDARAGVGYEILREFQPAEDGAKLAKLALENARAANTELFLDGALVGLLRDGGYLVVEYDRMTDRALALHLVTRGEDGQKIIDTEKIEGEMTVHDVKDVTEHTQTFLTKLFTARSPELTALVKQLADEIPNDDESDGDPYFDVPTEVMALASPQEIEEMELIQVRSILWIIRYALTLPGYVANPEAALKAGWGQRNKLLDDLLATKGITKEQPSDEEEEEEEAVPIYGLQQFGEHLALFRELAAYLDAHDVPEQSRTMFSLNLAIATVPLEVFASRTDHGEPALCGATVALFVTCWSRERNGELRLTRLDVVGD